MIQKAYKCSETCFRTIGEISFGRRRKGSAYRLYGRPEPNQTTKTMAEKMSLHISTLHFSERIALSSCRLTIING